MKKSLFLPFLFVWGLCFAVLCGCTAPEEILRFDPESQQSVRIGVVLPLTGKNAVQGKKMLAGARLAVDSLNSRRGHFGRTVELVVEDSSSTGSGAAAALERAVTSGAIGIVGGYSSVEAQAITDLARRRRVPLVIPMATGNDDIIGSNSFVFRAVFTDRQQAEMIAGFMKYYRRVNRLAVTVSSNPDDIYSRNVARDVADAFKNLGGEVIAMCEVDPAKPQEPLRQAVSFVPDAVILPFEASTAAKCYKILRELGYAGLIGGPDSWDDPQFFHSLQGIKKLGNSFYTAFYSDEARHSEFSAFRKEFREKNFYYPGSCEIQTFDAVNMLLIGFGNDAVDLKKFQKNWLGIRKHAGAAAIYTMKRNNAIDRTIYINRIGTVPELGNKPVPRNIAGLQYSRLEDYNVGLKEK